MTSRRTTHHIAIQVNIDWYARRSSRDKRKTIRESGAMTSRELADSDTDNLKIQQLDAEVRMCLRAKFRRAQLLDVTTQIKLEEFPKGFEAQILQNLRDLKLLQAEGSEEDGGLSQGARRTWSWLVESCHADGLMVTESPRIRQQTSLGWK